MQLTRDMFAIAKLLYMLYKYSVYAMSLLGLFNDNSRLQLPTFALNYSCMTFFGTIT